MIDSGSDKEGDNAEIRESAVIDEDKRVETKGQNVEASLVIGGNVVLRSIDFCASAEIDFSNVDISDEFLRKLMELDIIHDKPDVTKEDFVLFLRY